MKRASTVLGSLAFAAFCDSCASGHEMSLGEMSFGLFLFGLAVFLYATSDSKLGHARNEDAKSRVAKVLAGEEAFFYLYLRPFNITNHLSMKNPSLQNVQDSLMPGRVQDFEHVLANTLELSGIPLIALGRPGETVGAGRYNTNDDNWESVFHALASAASGILVVPSLNSGTLYEVRWLVANNKISETVFLQPSGFPAGEWSDVTQAYREIGLFLIRDSASGKMFKLGPDGHVIYSIPLATLWNGPVGGQSIQSLKLMGETGEPRE